MIHVTKSFLPDFSEYEKYLRGIWERGWLTNNGECVLQLERDLRSHLGVKELWFCNNGTITLQFAIRALELKDEIITTPFSYVATSSSIIWEHCIPVFADIEPHTLTIDVSSIEKKITTKTSAILATHVYGNPCDVDPIKKLALKYNLKVIYDAAHAFGVEYNGTNICNYGDISTISFHATKLFHTIEGGAVVTADPALSKKLYLMRQFGHIGDEHFSLGINGKASEFHAAMGLCMLPKINMIICSRRKASMYYDELLDNPHIQKPIIRPGTKYNYAYYPILLKNESTLMQVMEALKMQDILPRRYFYPSLNTLPYMGRKDKCPVSECISKRVLSLPLFSGIDRKDIKRIAEIINKVISPVNHCIMQL